MTPVAEIPREAWARVEGLATDLDETLTSHGTLTAASLAALETLHTKGFPCVIATGRPLGWAEVLASLLPVRAVVAENGGAWAVREGRGVRLAFLDDDAVRAEGMQRSRAMAARVIERFALNPVRESALRATDVTLDIGERERVPREVVSAAMAFVREAGLHAVASAIHLHVSYRAPDKMGGLRAAVGDLGLDARALTDRWIYLGDSPNDAGPFAAMDLSVGVCGVERYAREMSAMPRYVTLGGPGEALPELASRLLARGAA